MKEWRLASEGVRGITALHITIDGDDQKDRNLLRSITQEHVWSFLFIGLLTVVVMTQTHRQCQFNLMPQRFGFDLLIWKASTSPQKCSPAAIMTTKWKIWWLAPQTSKRYGIHLSGIYLWSAVHQRMIKQVSNSGKDEMRLLPSIHRLWHLSHWRQPPSSSLLLVYEMLPFRVYGLRHRERVQSQASDRTPHKRWHAIASVRSTWTEVRKSISHNMMHS